MADIGSASPSRVRHRLVDLSLIITRRVDQNKRPPRLRGVVGETASLLFQPRVLASEIPYGPSDPKLKEFFAQNQDTIFDRLSEKGRRWGVYFYDFPCSLILNHQRRPENVAHYSDIKNFFDDVRNESTFPDFVFIEPKYSGQDQNDDHPPHNVLKGEKLIADVYNAIRSYDDLWNSTLLVVVFDEHGGFYDHVPPPIAVPPDGHDEEYTFDRLGVRVPVLLISPWVGRRVEHTQFDHTSLLKYLIQKWGLNPLGQRTAAANDIAVALTEKTLRTDTVAFVRVPYTDLVPSKPELEHQDDSGHHKALQAFTAYLGVAEDQIGTDALQLAATSAGHVVELKNELGKQLIAMGNNLTKDMEQFRQKQAIAAKNAIMRVLASHASSANGRS